MFYVYESTDCKHVSYEFKVTNRIIFFFLIVELIKHTFHAAFCQMIMTERGYNQCLKH